MAKYGSFKCSAAKYGYVNPGRTLSWGLLIDWLDTGNYVDGYNEAYGYDNNPGKLFSLTTKAGRQYFINSDNTGFEPVDNSTMQIELTDLYGRYDPYNEDGQLYQYILPGKKFKLFVMDETTQTKYFIMVGRIDDIRPSYGQIQTVTITGYNGIAELKNTTVRSTQIYTDIQYEDAITTTLTEANWSGGLNIDTASSEIMPYWWLSGDSAFNELQSICAAARSTFFVSKDGTATYYTSVNSPDPIVSFVDHDALKEYGIRVPTPWDSIKNYIRVYAKARISQSGTIWTLQSTPPAISAGGSITIWVEYTDANGNVAPATSITTPVANTDFTANSNSDGTGTDLTSSITIAITSFASSAKLVISNSSGTAAYLTLLQLRGTVIAADEYTYSEYQDDNSIDIYGRREFYVKTDWLQNINVAEEFGNWIIKILADPRQFPRFQVRAQPAKQFTPDLFDIVSVSFTSKNITGNFRVGYIEHKWVQRNGNIVDTTFYLEPNIAGNVTGTWIFPATFGYTTIF